MPQGHDLGGRQRAELNDFEGDLLNDLDPEDSRQDFNGKSRREENKLTK